MKLKNRSEIAKEIAYKITLNKRCCVINKNGWRIERAEVMQQLQQLLTENQKCLLNDDFFEDIISALDARLTLFFYGVTRY